MVIKLEKLGRDNDYSLECESDQLEKLEYILKNVFLMGLLTYLKMLKNLDFRKERGCRHG